MGESLNFEDIIRKGKIPTSEIPGSSPTWWLYALYFLVSVWGLFYINLKWTEMQLFGTIIMVFLLAFSIYIPIETLRKLRITFYEDSKPLDYKERLIQKQKDINRWELLKSDRNYYLFFENNLIIQSYYITILVDDKGFYLNCFPNKGRVLDFGCAQRWRDQLYEDLVACL